MQRLGGLLTAHRLVVVGEAPRLSNGKLNETALDDLMGSAIDAIDGSGADHADPLRQLLDRAWPGPVVWADAAPSGEDFFRAGGDSLQLISVVEAIQDALRVEMPLELVLDEPTPPRIAALVAEAVLIHSLAPPSDAPTDWHHER